MTSPLPLALEATVLVLGLSLLVVEMFMDRLNKKTLAWAGIAGLATVFVMSFFAKTPADLVSVGGMAGNYTDFYSDDALAMFFKRFALLTTIIVLVMSVDYLPVVRKFTPGATAQGGLGEFLSLPVMTCAGLMWMASAIDFVMIFVSLELVTISFYVLVSYTRRNAATLEAGVKYLILSALSTGFLVYGITWVFGLTGQTNLARVAQVFSHYQGSHGPILFSFVLIAIALGFKIAAAPLQFWVPDVYQGAPTPVTAFLSVGSKAAGFVVLMRVVPVFLVIPEVAQRISVIFGVMAGLTLIYGNLAAMPQNNLKRLLAYSSIAHAGYLLIAVTALARNGLANADSFAAQLLPDGAISFYLAAYLLMTLLSFVVMIVVANSTVGDDIADFNGLAKRSPYLAFAMMVAMLSLAGIPFTAGFFGKFFVFAVAMAQKQYLLVGIGIVAVACGFYYYLKVVRAMYFQPVGARSDAAATPIALSGVTRVCIAALIAGIFYLGIYPLPALHVLDRAPKLAVTLKGQP
jgi:NADH-quinone oxidoreductase subunit N